MVVLRSDRLSTILVSSLISLSEKIQKILMGKHERIARNTVFKKSLVTPMAIRCELPMIDARETKQRLYFKFKDISGHSLKRIHDLILVQIDRSVRYFYKFSGHIYLSQNEYELEKEDDFNRVTLTDATPHGERTYLPPLGFPTHLYCEGEKP